MKLAAFSLLCLSCCNLSAASGKVIFEWTTIGNPANVGDTEIAGDGTTGFGSVPYLYRISRYEVTNSQYVEFLNSVAKSDPNNLYNPLMGSDTVGGIIRTDDSGNYSYSVKSAVTGVDPNQTEYAYADKPVVYISFLDSLRFVNWLQNGQPVGPQDATTTEAGVYTIGGGLDETRNSSATYFLPSEDEWYKAAYHMNDGDTGNYWDFPTSSNQVPENKIPTMDSGNSANFSNPTPATGNSSYPLTDVGAYNLSSSPYGTFDQAGSVWEWNEAVVGTNRGVRGGSWAGTPDGSHANVRLGSFISIGMPTNESNFIGMRIASAIPEPASGALFSILSLGLVSAKSCRRRFRR